MSMPLRDTIAAIVLLAIAAVYGTLTSELPERLVPNTPGPAFFPTLIATIIAVLAATLLVRGISRLRGAPALSGEVTNSAKAVLMLVWFLAFLAGLPYLGFLVTAIPFFAGMMVLYGNRNPFVIVISSIAVPVALFFLFREGFNILLPSGPWM